MLNEHLSSWCPTLSDTPCLKVTQACRSQEEKYSCCYFRSSSAYFKICVSRRVCGILDYSLCWSHSSVSAALLSLSPSFLPLMSSLSVSHASSTLMILPSTRRPLSFSTIQRAWSGSQSGQSLSMYIKVSELLRAPCVLAVSLFLSALGCADAPAGNRNIHLHHQLITGNYILTLSLKSLKYFLPS